jgi:hypothetical protein
MNIEVDLTIPAIVLAAGLAFAGTGYMAYLSKTADADKVKHLVEAIKISSPETKTILEKQLIEELK